MLNEAHPEEQSEGLLRAQQRLLAAALPTGEGTGQGVTAGGHCPGADGTGRADGLLIF